MNINRNKIRINRNKQSGLGILIVLIMAAVLSGVLAAVLAGGANSASMVSNNNASQTIAAQAGLIRSRILQCSTAYPSGNNGTGFRATYPAGVTTVNVSTLVCPGSALNLWNQSDGVFMPSPPAGFNAWQFTNDATSMRLTISASTADRIAILPAIANLLGPQASVSGSTLTWMLSL